MKHHLLNIPHSLKNTPMGNELNWLLKKESGHTLMLLLIARTKFSDFSDQRHYR